METRNCFRLMCVLAHPDDESLGMGGALAKYAAEGGETYVVTATKGERGRSGSKEPLTLEAVGHLRDAELQAAASVLGVREVSFLGYSDGALDRANPTEATGRIVAQLRRVKPQVVLTFAPDGAYGHPDHIAILPVHHCGGNLCGGPGLPASGLPCAASCFQALLLGVAHRQMGGLPGGAK